jgi:ankyrin repeat protein
MCKYYQEHCHQPKNIKLSTQNLMEALDKKQLDDIKHYLANATTEDLNEFVDTDGRTALHLAIDTLNTAIVEAVKEKTSDYAFNKRDNDGNTPINYVSELCYILELNGKIPLAGSLLDAVCGYTVSFISPANYNGSYLSSDHLLDYQ